MEVIICNSNFVTNILSKSMKKNKTIKVIVQVLIIVCVSTFCTYSSVMAQNHSDKGKVIIWIPSSDTPKPRHAPSQQPIKTIYLKFLEDVNEVTVEIYEDGQMTDVIKDSVSKEEILPLSVRPRTDIQIKVYADGFLIEELSI